MKDVLISFFPISILLYYYYFSLAWLLEVRTSNTMLKRIGESKHLLTWMRGKPFTLLFLSVTFTKGVLSMAFFVLKLIPATSNLLKVFVLLVFKSCQVVEFDSSEFFFVFIAMIVRSLYFILSLCITFIF